MASREFITKEVFDKVKVMLSIGKFSQAQIGNFMEISQSTVNRINVAEDFDAYQTKIQMRTERQNELKRKRETECNAEKVTETVASEPEKQIIEHRQTVTMVANHYMAEEMKKQTELLTVISNKLCFIVEELTK